MQLAFAQGAKASPVQAGQSSHAEGGRSGHRARVEPAKQVQGNNVTEEERDRIANRSCWGNVLCDFFCGGAAGGIKF